MESLISDSFLLTSSSFPSENVALRYKNVISKCLKCLVFMKQNQTAMIQQNHPASFKTQN